MSGGSEKQLSQVGRRHAIMRARTRRLARPRDIGPLVPTINCLLCEAGGQPYAIPLTRIARVAPSVRLAQVPTTNRALLGVTGRAGVFYHVYDLATLVGAEAGKGGHIVMLRGTPHIALQVENASGVAEVAALDAAEAVNLRPSHPSITGFVRLAQQDATDGRTISFIEPDKLASLASTGRVEGDSE